MIFAVAALHGQANVRTFAPSFSLDPLAPPTHGPSSAGWVYYLQSQRRPRRHTAPPDVSDLHIAVVRPPRAGLAGNRNPSLTRTVSLPAHDSVPYPLVQPLELLVDRRRGCHPRVRARLPSVRLRPAWACRRPGRADPPFCTRRSAGMGHDATKDDLYRRGFWCASLCGALPSRPCACLAPDADMRHLARPLHPRWPDLDQQRSAAPHRTGNLRRCLADPTDVD
jgi:hypothetical protein